MGGMLVESAAPGGAHETDVIIIGAGPGGLFAVFELGLLGAKAHVIDILDKPGGQCAELYPEKPILDIPGIKSISADQLVVQLIDQIDPFGAVFHLGEMADSMTRSESGKWRVTTDMGTSIEAPVVLIAAGGGSFTPKRPPIPGVEEYENKSVHYAVRRREMFRDKTIVIAGGGDSALDWAINLEPIAKKLILIHRRPEFRSAPDTADKFMALVKAGKVDFHVAQIKGLKGDDGMISAVAVEAEGKGAYDVPCETMIAFYGLTMKLGPIADFGLNFEENRVIVDTEKFETSTPGVFCIGDMAYYPGKLKLILSAFHEAALMSHGAFHYIFPEKKLKFQHTTSSKELQQTVTGTTQAE